MCIFMAFDGRWEDLWHFIHHNHGACGREEAFWAFGSTWHDSAWVLFWGLCYDTTAQTAFFFGRFHVEGFTAPIQQSGSNMQETAFCTTNWCLLIPKST
jgi:hypothetical protein